MTNPDRTPLPRRRTALLLAATIAMGLASRRPASIAWLGEYPGDALYAAAAAWALLLLRPTLAAWQVGTLAFVAASLVELQQLLAWPWLVELRQTTLGALLLGQGFQWQDLLAYLVGATTAAGLAAVARPRSISPASPGSRSTT
jgi:hypothetical protein